jgi:hypothetical protein
MGAQWEPSSLVILLDVDHCTRANLPLSIRDFPMHSAPPRFRPSRTHPFLVPHSRAHTAMYCTRPFIPHSRALQPSHFPNPPVPRSAFTRHTYCTRPSTLRHTSRHGCSRYPYPFLVRSKVSNGLNIYTCQVLT